MKKLVMFMVLTFCALGGMMEAQISGAGQLGCSSAQITGTAWNSGTSNNSTQTLMSGVAAQAWLVQLDQTTTLTGGAITFQVTYDGTNYVTVPVTQVLNSNTGAQLTNPYTLVASTNQPFLIVAAGATNLQLKLTTAITGTGAITPYTTGICTVPTSPLSLDSSGYLQVDIKAGAGSASNITQWNTVALGSPSNYGTSPGAVSVIGVNAFVTNTPAVTQSGNWTSRTVGNAGAIMDAAGQNASSPANELLIAGQFNSSPTTITTGNVSPLQLDASGNLKVNVNANSFGTLTENLGQVGGSSVVTAATGVQKVGVVGNTGAAIDAATGAAPPVNAILHAGLASGATGGFLLGITNCDKDAVINISTATTTLAITGVSSRQARICSINLVTAAANNVALVEGTGGTCGTGTAGMNGGTTAATGWNFAANGGIAQGMGIGEVMTTATAGDSICIISSAATQLSGHIKYTIY